MKNKNKINDNDFIAKIKDAARYKRMYNLLLGRNQIGQKRNLAIDCAPFICAVLLFINDAQHSCTSIVISQGLITKAKVSSCRPV